MEYTKEWKEIIIAIVITTAIVGSIDFIVDYILIDIPIPIRVLKAPLNTGLGSYAYLLEDK